MICLKEQKFKFQPPRFETEAVYKGSIELGAKLRSKNVTKQVLKLKIKFFRFDPILFTCMLLVVLPNIALDNRK